MTKYRLSFNVNVSLKFFIACSSSDFISFSFTPIDSMLQKSFRLDLTGTDSFICEYLAVCDVFTRNQYKHIYIIRIIVHIVCSACKNPSDF